MREQEKKRQRIIDQMEPNISDIIGVSLQPSSSPKRNPLDNAIRSVLENKIKANFPFKYCFAFEEEWKKMSEEFTLNACK